MEFLLFCSLFALIITRTKTMTSDWTLQYSFACVQITWRKLCLWHGSIATVHSLSRTKMSFFPLFVNVLSCLVLTTHSCMVVGIISTDWMNKQWHIRTYTIQIHDRNCKLAQCCAGVGETEKYWNCISIIVEWSLFK